ncbi:MAG: hypothetical protein ACYS9X_27915, partial [Planctomycetota bacterium]
SGTVYDPIYRKVTAKGDKNGRTSAPVRATEITGEMPPAPEALSNGTITAVAADAPAVVWSDRTEPADAGGGVFGGTVVEPKSADIFGEGQTHVIGAVTNYGPDVGKDGRPAAPPWGRAAGSPRGA